MKKRDEDIYDLLKSKFSQENIRYEDSYWKEAETVIEQQQAASKIRRLGTMFFTTSFLILLSVWYFAMNYEMPGKIMVSNSPINNESIAQIKPFSIPVKNSIKEIKKSKQQEEISLPIENEKHQIIEDSRTFETKKNQNENIENRIITQLNSKDGIKKEMKFLLPIWNKIIKPKNSKSINKQEFPKFNNGFSGINLYDFYGKSFNQNSINHKNAVENFNGVGIAYSKTIGKRIAFNIGLEYSNHIVPYELKKPIVSSKIEEQMQEVITFEVNQRIEIKNEYEFINGVPFLVQSNEITYYDTTYSSAFETFEIEVFDTLSQKGDIWITKTKYLTVPVEFSIGKSFEKFGIDFTLGGSFQKRVSQKPLRLEGSSYTLIDSYRTYSRIGGRFSYYLQPKWTAFIGSNYSRLLVGKALNKNFLRGSIGIKYSF